VHKECLERQLQTHSLPQGLPSPETGRKQIKNVRKKSQGPAVPVLGRLEGLEP
jgi:hypothetical protein